MIIELDMENEVPIYIQLRNAIVVGIGKGELKPGDRLPSVRQMAEDIGVNMMTVNKTYMILKNEGFLSIDRRKGACISTQTGKKEEFLKKLQEDLMLLISEASFYRISREEFSKRCDSVYQCMDSTRKEGYYDNSNH